MPNDSELEKLLAIGLVECKALRDKDDPLRCLFCLCVVVVVAEIESQRIVEISSRLQWIVEKALKKETEETLQKTQKKNIIKY